MVKLAFLCLIASAVLAKQPLVVLSVDGLDNRYLKDVDRLGLKIPNLRRLMRDGQLSQGVIGVVPTVTWPSHTTLITGVDPVVHGILGNQKPKAEGGDYYWSSSLIKTPTLLTAAHAAGLTTATITWPVTVDAPVDWNLPEYFKRRRGGSMDTASIESKCQPADLVSKISAAFPSFPQEWMDDRTRTLAAIYLLKNQHPDLMLIHFVDLDSEEHDNAPFSKESLAILERTDELLGQILAAMPQNYAIAVVSDHGFESVNRTVTLNAIPNVRAFGGTATALDETAAQTLRALAHDPASGVGREIPKTEQALFPSAGPAGIAMFESTDGVMFWNAAGKPAETGNHGHWPLRYRAVYLLWGKGIPQESLPELSMKTIAGRLAQVIGVPFSSTAFGTAGQPAR